MNLKPYSCLFCLGAFIVSAFGMFSDALPVSAEIYQYTDNQGIIHLTDNPQNIPESIRNKSKREEPLPLSSQDKKIFNELMRRGDIERDLPFTSPKEVKEGATFLRETLRKELVDPEELDRPLDPRLASPEGAINLYRTALTTGNMSDLKTCVTNDYWERMAPEFVAWGKQKMAVIGKEIFLQAEIKKIRQNETEARFILIKPEDGIEMAYPIIVEKVFGNWEISVF